MSRTNKRVSEIKEVCFFCSFLIRRNVFFVAWAEQKTCFRGTNSEELFGIPKIYVEQYMYFFRFFVLCFVEFMRDLAFVLNIFIRVLIFTKKIFNFRKKFVYF